MASNQRIRDEICELAIQRLGVADAIVVEHQVQPSRFSMDDGLWHNLSVRRIIGAPLELFLRRRSRAELLAAINAKTL